jgi:hypothetical protein
MRRRQLATAIHEQIIHDQLESVMHAREAMPEVKPAPPAAVIAVQSPEPTATAEPHAQQEEDQKQ